MLLRSHRSPATAPSSPLAPRRRTGRLPRRLVIGFALAAATLLPHSTAQPLRRGGVDAKFVAVSDEVVAPSDGPEPPGLLVGAPTRDARLRAGDGAGGEIAVKEGWPSCVHGSNMRGGRFCGSCGNSACRDHHCHFGWCRDCTSDSHCPSEQMCDLVSGGWTCANRFPVGRACNQNRLCQSGHCQGVCRECLRDNHCGDDQFCRTGRWQCADKGSIGDWCEPTIDPTHLTDNIFHPPCGDGLSCYLAGDELGFKCLPSADGCYAGIMRDFLNENVGNLYSGVNGEAKGILENAGSATAEQIVNLVTGDGDLLEMIRSVACGTKELVMRYVDRFQQCQSITGFEKDVKLGASQGQGAETGPYNLTPVFMAGGLVDLTFGIAGASLGFGVAVEIANPPQVALYASACSGVSIGWEAGAGVSAAMQFGGGFGATRGLATEVVNPDFTLGVGAGVSFSYSHSDPQYYTLAISVDTGAGVDVDIMHPCFAWVSPTVQDMLSAATCSVSEPEYYLIAEGEKCGDGEHVSEADCLAAANAVTDLDKSAIDVVQSWNWAPCKCFIWRGDKIQFNQYACNNVVLDDRAINGQEVCRTSVRGRAGAAADVPAALADVSDDNTMARSKVTALEAEVATLAAETAVLKAAGAL